MYVEEKMSGGPRFKYVNLEGTTVCPNEQSHKKRKIGISCTNILLSLIALFTFVQAIIVLTATVSTVNFYENNKEKIDEWANLPWDQMAHTVETTFEQEKQTPVAGTLSNVFSAAQNLKHAVEYQGPKIKMITDEMVKNKDMFQKISHLTEETLPAVQKIHNALADAPVADLTGVIHKTNKVMSYLEKDKKKIKETYDRSSTLIDQVNNLLHPDNVQKSLDALDKIATTMDSTLTTDNVNKTIHAISDFDKSLHRAEDRLHKIGEIFGK